MLSVYNLERSTQTALRLAAKLLTLCTALLLTNCAYIDRRYGEHCKNHAYLKQSLHEYILQRFGNHGPARLAIVPFTVPANLTWQANSPGVENELTWKIHARMLESGEFPITEVLNRQDWPGKKEEFYTGNFGAIRSAREAGYDFVLVGFVQDLNDLSSMVADTKIIEVESGMTIWYGKSTATTDRPSFDQTSQTFWIEDRNPSVLYSRVLIDTLARCVVKGAIADPE